jgi:hypothetical protein
MHDPSAPQKEYKKAPQQVTDHVVHWMKSKETSFRGMASTQGGTEIWCQYDFEIATKLRQGIDVETKMTVREKSVYDNVRSKADWVFPSQNHHAGLIIELKVESSSLKQKGKELAKLVVKDQEKVLGKLNKGYEEYQQGVFALAWTPETHKALKDVHMIEVAGSRINFKSRPSEYICLYEWDGETAGEVKEDTSSSNPLAPNAPLANPGAQTLPFHNTPGTQRPQTPGTQMPGVKDTDETPGGMQTPSKKPKSSKGVKGLLNMIKKPGGDSSKKGPGGDSRSIF